MAIEIKQVNGLQTALDAKADSGDVPETGAEGLVLTASQTSITPSGKPTIYLYRAPASLPGDVTFLANYTTGIDADFAAGTATGTIAAGSPTVSGGYLDLNAGGAASSVEYVRQNNFPDHGTFDTFTIRAMVKLGDSVPGDGTYPIVDLPNYTSNCAVQAINVNRRVLHILVLAGQPYFAFRIYAGNNTLTVNMAWAIPSWVAGQEYEVEASSQQDPDNHRLFVDGTLRVSNTNNPLGGNIYDGNNNVFYVGGQGGSTSCNSIGGSAFQIGGVALFDTIQHTASYTAEGLPGAGTTVENIDEIVTTNYADGEEITIFTPEFEGYTFETGGNLLLASSFDPTLEKGFLKLQRNGADWVETQRSAGGAVNPVDPTESTTTYTCTASESVGDLVYISAADTVARADASAIGTSRVLGHIVEKPTTTTCKVSLSPGPVAATGLTVGSPVYLSDSTPGGVSATEGTIIVEVGIADTTTSFVFTGYKIVG